MDWNDPYTYICSCCGFTSDEGSTCWQCEDCPPDYCHRLVVFRRFTRRRLVRLADEERGGGC